MECRNIIAGIISLIILGAVNITAHAEEIVIQALPITFSSSTAKNASHKDLSNEETAKARLLITKSGEKYYWSSRDDRELVYVLSGAIHLFIDPRGAGYIEIYDSHVMPENLRPKGKRFQYKEHMRMLLTNYNYWGESESYKP